MATRWLLLLSLLSVGAARADAPLFYLPFDDGPSATVAAGDPRERSGSAAAPVGGVRGQAASIHQDLRFASAGNFRPGAGTFACWLRPEWPGSGKGPHYIFSLYGAEGALPGWQANRWSIAEESGRVVLSLFDAAGKSHAGSAAIAGWQAGEWHHVAATWQGISAGRADGELRLFLDGVAVGSALTGVRLEVGQVGQEFCLGRDSDASPDYAAAAMDDVYLYGRALDAAEIARTVDAVRSGRIPALGLASTPARAVPGWDDPTRPYRVRITLAAEDAARDRVCAALPLDLGADLARLGQPSAIDPSSLRLLDARADQRPREVPVAVREGRILFTVGPIPAGQRQEFFLYFRARSYDLSLPLLARAPLEDAASRPASVVLPDYATDAYGKAWDFDKGDTEAIDQWGNKPEYIRNRRVEDGVLKMDVSGDAYFIWGDMWGQIQRSQRPVSIDLQRYSLLEMRVRQSVPQALWRIYGRPGHSENLMRHDFRVSGTGWQTVRVDLRGEARWRGVLTAFRIDPVKETPAHVEIDWVRLLSLAQARRAPVEAIGSAPGAVRVSIAMAQARPQAGAEQSVRVSVRAADGRPLAGNPVCLALAPGSGGTLSPEERYPALPLEGGIRALTGPDGTATFHFRVSRRAGAEADRLVATAEFSAAPAAALAVAAQPGPPARYVLTPEQPQFLRPGDPPLKITACLADALGNPVPGGGRALSWSAPGAILENAGTRTAPDGSATAVLRADPAQRWVVRVEARDGAGLTGRSAEICALSAGPRPDPIRLLPNGYFAQGERPWLPLGGFYANWVGVPTADGQWDRRLSFTEATDEQIVAWLRFLKEHGVTAERFMLRTHRPDGMEPMDIGGRVNPGLFAAFLHYLDLARPFGMRFLLVLHEDYTKPLYFDRDALERYALPWYAGQNLDRLPSFQRRFIRDRRLIEEIGEKYTDPEVIACQDQYARELVGLMKGNPLLLGYELENEMVACPASWANHAIATIRSVDPTVPICVSHGGGGLATADPAWWSAKTAIDFYTYHLYPSGTTSPECDYGTAVDVLTRYGRLGKPAFLGESAGDEFSAHPSIETRRWSMRDIIWFALTNGNPGCFFWNARGSEVAEFGLANTIAARIDWTRFRRRPAPVLVSVPHPLDDDRWFRTGDGKAAYVMMARYARYFLDRGADFDFTLDARPGANVLDVTRFTPPEAPPADFGVSAGYQLKPLVCEDGSEALLYARNFAGVERWDATGTYKGTLYLRRRAPAALRLTVRLPGRFSADIWDLDTGRHEQRAVASGEAIDLGASEHDFAVHLKRSRQGTESASGLGSGADRKHRQEET